MTALRSRLFSRRTLAVGLVVSGLAAAAPAAQAAPARHTTAKAPAAKVVGTLKAEGRTGTGTRLKIWRRT